MRKNLLITLLLACTIMVQAKEVKIKVVISGTVSFKPVLDLGYERIYIDPTNGIGEIVFDIDKPQFAKIEVLNHYSQNLYLEPGNNLTISCSADGKLKDIKYEGENITENIFINTPKVYSFDPLSHRRDYSLNEYSTKLDSIVEVNRGELKAKGFSENFTKLESKRIYVNSSQRFLRDVSREDPNFTDILKKRMSLDASYLAILEHRNFMETAIRILVSSENQNLSGLKKSEASVRKICEVIKDRETRSFLVDLYVVKHISSAGLKGADYLTSTYRKEVVDPKKIVIFDEIYGKYKKLDKGESCPDFTFKDVDDRDVSLKDLKGKYVYIDLWATWCGPCKEEIPFMQKLEEKYHGKEIHFVGISIDKKKDIPAWKAMVKEKNMGGLQLNFMDNWDWVKLFMPGTMSVPRFVLLDRDGKFIDANMSRPSDVETVKIFDEILKIK